MARRDTRLTAVAKEDQRKARLVGRVDKKTPSSIWQSRLRTRRPIAGSPPPPPPAKGVVPSASLSAPVANPFLHLPMEVVDEILSYLRASTLYSTTRSLDRLFRRSSIAVLKRQSTWSPERNLWQVVSAPRPHPPAHPFTFPSIPASLTCPQRETFQTESGVLSSMWLFRSVKDCFLRDGRHTFLERLA